MAKSKIEPGKKYLVSFIGDDVNIFDKYIGIISKDKKARYKAGEWILCADTANKILNLIPSNSLTIEEYKVIDDDINLNIGNIIKANLYPYQRDVVEYCLKHKNAIIVAPCGAGK